MQNSINQVEETIYTTLKTIYKSGLTIAYNKYTQLFLIDKPLNQDIDTQEEYYQYRLELSRYLTEMMRYIINSNENIKDIALVDPNERVFTFQSIISLNNYKHAINKLLKKTGHLKRYNWVHNDDILNTNNLKTYYFSLIIPIYSTLEELDNLEPLGTLVILCNTAVINQISQKSLITPNSSFIITDENGKIVSSSDSSLIGEIFNKNILVKLNKHSGIFISQYQGKKSLIQYKNISETNWKLISIIPWNELTSNITQLTFFVFIIGVIMLVLLSLTGYVFILNITRPVSQIINTIKDISVNNNIKQRIQVTTKNEIGLIAYEFNKMLDSIEKMTETILKHQSEIYEVKLAKSRAEFTALKSQINPHFLYNTLDCIRNLAFMYDAPEIVKIATSMANIFRYSIKGKEYVTLHEEIECINDYLKIMNIRFANKFNTQINIPEELFKAKILKMILQPIVENAIYHGLERKLGNGNLIISASAINDILQITIHDDGKGIPEDELSELLAQMEKEILSSYHNKNEETRSTGIINVHKRIKLYYGESYGLKIYSKLNEGTTVTIEIPLILDEQ